MMTMRHPVNASSSISRSNTVSMGSLFHNLAISAMILPCSGTSLGFCTAPPEWRPAFHLLPLVVPVVRRRLHLLADARARGGVLQALDHLLVAAVVRPGRDDRRERIEPAGYA
jgi:hypothetical protein